jgi:hypothetical protein
MREIVEYMVLTGVMTDTDGRQNDTAEVDLAGTVEEAIRNGWQPFGSPWTWGGYRWSDGLGPIRMSQAMVRYGGFRQW